ncbi:uridine kinase [Xylanimonas allomyrinae]|uniref:Uridine kinase n=1 Tax=Xylanimonas allomyrinae TaxID=2509459 RepID=A0A4P6F167_9MICO|nr:uridine kinase [Xylanimonas allomyrinae]QAY64078.1 uridine kinase [Xylanimonas allomyrinae]
MRAEPVTFEALIEHVVAVTAATSGNAASPGTARVLVDGHPATRPWALADALVAPLRAAGRPVARVRTRDFWRPASLRLEHGRRDPDALLDRWVDAGALNREVLTAVVTRGRYLPTLRDPVTDRSTRAAYVAAAPGTVVVLDGSLTLGLGLDVDVSVHLALSRAAETRGTALDDAWQLAAYDRYRREAAPERRADVVVRYDDARHPALVRRDR